MYFHRFAKLYALPLYKSLDTERNVINNEINVNVVQLQPFRTLSPCAREQKSNRTKTATITSLWTNKRGESEDPREREIKTMYTTKHVKATTFAYVILSNDLIARRSVLQYTRRKRYILSHTTRPIQAQLWAAVRTAHNVLNTYSWAELRCTVVSFEFVFENCRYWLGYQFPSDPYYSLKMFIFENDKVVDVFDF